MYYFFNKNLDKRNVYLLNTKLLKILFSESEIYK